MRKRKKKKTGHNHEAIMATLLANQKKWGESLTKTTLSGSIFSLSNVLLPIIRTSYPTLMANNWVNVQPMIFGDDYWDLIGREDFDFN